MITLPALNKRERLTLETFGANLIQTEDLDPIYVVLHHSFTLANEERMRRWLLAYWCCYHAGCASYLSEFQGAQFWDVMTTWANNVTLCPTSGRWPRGRERRHFRGAKGIAAVQFLAHHYPKPEEAVRSLEASKDYADLMDRIQMWPMFGPWIAFKIADMMDRVLGVSIHFPASVVMYDSPTKAANRWAEEMNEQGGLLLGDQRVRILVPTGPKAVMAAIDFLHWKLVTKRAPPDYKRELNVQEFETILCKWGAHMTGHYPIGIDTHELYESLVPWSRTSDTAADLLTCLPGMVHQ